MVGSSKIYQDTSRYFYYYYFAVEDLERNNGFDKPYFMNKELQNILGVKNKAQDHPDHGTVEMQENK